MTTRYLIGNRDEGQFHITPHLCCTLTLAEIAKAALEAEFGIPCTILPWDDSSESIQSLWLDFGGNGISGCNLFKIPFSRPELPRPAIFSFLPQHLYDVLAEFNVQLPQVQPGGFIRLVGHRFVICLYLEDARNIRTKILENFSEMKVVHDRWHERFYGWVEKERARPHPSIRLVPEEVGPKQ